MRALFRKIHNALWTSLGGPHHSSFRRQLDPWMSRDYPGRAADLFFSNTGEPIHKWPHYLPIYDALFANVPGDVGFLELGVFRGGSLRLWRKYFGDRATIYGVDIDPSCAQFDGEAGQVRIGSQSDPAFLRSVVEEMGGVDIVLDDGSHVASDQSASFETLFPLLNEGGLYVIEDTHTSYWPKHDGGYHRRGTAIEFLKDKVDAMHRHYRLRGVNTPEAIPEIESIQFFDSIVAIRKRRQLPRYSVLVPSQTLEHHGGHGE